MAGALVALAERLQGICLGRGLTVALAESCTGGLVAASITSVPGSSGFFLGGVVSYANEAKSSLLGVEPSLLRAHGAVSEPVVRAMALGALDHLGGELSVAVSGIAGPDGGTRDKPVGTVWIAWGRRLPGDGCDLSAKCEILPGDRESIRRWAVQRALAGLLER